MGMYTELIFSAELDGNLPADVKNIIKYMCTGENKPEKLPEHGHIIKNFKIKEVRL